MSHTDRLLREQALPDDGWSHNPHDAAAPHSDLDRRATEIADRYIGLLTDAMAEYGVLPITGVEVNFTASGAADIEQNIIGYINQETERYDAARKVVPADASALFARLKDLPVFLGSADSSAEHSDMAETFQSLVTPIIEPGEIDFKAIGRFVFYADAIVYNLKKDQRKPQVNPEFLETAKTYCRQIIKDHVLTPRRGAFSSAYIAERIEGDHILVDFPEITTPPRIPSHTVKQVNRIKSLLLQSSARFSGDENISPIARRMRKGTRDYLRKAQENKP